MTKKLWGGRFSKEIDPLADEFSKSIQYDHKLAEFDILGSMVHTEVLKKSGYLKKVEAAKLCKALKSLYAAARNGDYSFDPASEDIHTDIQNKLQKKVGSLVLKLQTARSRNDQVAFTTKLYAKAKLSELESLASGLAASLDLAAAKNKDLVIPGFTHMQHAQPVYVKDYLGAYAQMLERDSLKLSQVSSNIKPVMGAGALAGTPVASSSYNIDMAKFAKGFKARVEATANSLDTVSDRDFVIEILAALSVVAMHLSRLSEDLIIWSTKEFGFVDIDEAYCTGSSLMPQKKNADILELARGNAGRIYGNLVCVLTMMKGLPLSYNRDMQLDKEPLFNSIEVVSSELKLLAGLIKTLKFNKANIARHLKDESLYATDIVYYLVDKGVAFKDAHTIVGKLVKISLKTGVPIKEMPESALKGYCDKFVKKSVVRLFDPKVSVSSKRSIKRKN
jgi:argininosuccinate lyase